MLKNNEFNPPSRSVVLFTAEIGIRLGLFTNLAQDFLSVLEEYHFFPVLVLVFFISLSNLLLAIVDQTETNLFSQLGNLVMLSTLDLNPVQRYEVALRLTLLLQFIQSLRLNALNKHFQVSLLFFRTLEVKFQLKHVEIVVRNFILLR